MYSKLPIILRKKQVSPLIFKWLLADRLYAAINKDAVQSCAHSETLLLQAYNVSPPPRYKYGIGTIRHKRQHGHWRLAAVPSVPFTVEHTAVCRRRWKLSFPGVFARFVL